MTAVFVPLLLAAITSASQGNPMPYDPQPNPKSVVQVGQARFTILTSHLIRMEWGGTNDAATFAFINRNLPTPPFNTSKDGDWTVIQTSAAKIHYLPSNQTFNSSNLEVSIQLNGQTVTWRPEPAASTTLNGNLLGTIRTLDRVNGSIDLNCHTQNRSDLHCQLGLVSTSGYVVVDNTNHPQFDNSEWPWVVNKTFPQPTPASCAAVKTLNRRDCGFLGISQFDCEGKGCCFDSNATTTKCYYASNSYNDLYFFGHGHDYKLALKEFTVVSGRIPLLPRYAYGIFYSRYWAYDDIGEMEVVKGYEQRDIPLDVLVTDMDWHITFYKEAAEGKKDQAGQTIGWTGFTWDKHLFPDPKGFLDWCKFKGLKNTLNLHPASGMQPWEEKYPEMAVAMGIDPETHKYVPFTPTDLKFVVNWFKIVLGERESEGIDFWWLDWQQGESWIKIPLVNPTIWLNYIFFTTPYHWRNNTIRPLLIHRWGGLGNHRYQVGLSGDVVPSWASLHFQVFFTLRATNVGFGYWSHDIGGHWIPPPSPELYTRWIQWGAFSPIFRTHCTKNPLNDRRIWVYPPANYKIMRNFILLRASLLPYVYSNARYAYDEGLSLLRPMYYEFPESSEAYSFDRQYFFGSDILVAPVTQAVDTPSQIVSKNIWIPQGTYISWFSGEMITGPMVIVKNFTLSEMPVFVRAGAIIPMKTDDFAILGSAQEIPTQLKFILFVGNAKSGSLFLYEDDGNSTKYITGAFANTSVSYTHDSDTSTLSVTIGPTSGSFTGLPSVRSYQISVPNFWPAEKVTIGGQELPYVPLRDSYASYEEDSWTYDGSTLSLIVNILTPHPVSGKVVVTVSYDSYKDFNPYWFSGYAGLLARLQQMKELLDNQWTIDTVYQEDYFALLNATETGRKITYNPADIITLTQQFGPYVTNAVAEVGALQNLNADIKAQVLAAISNQ